MSKLFHGAATVLLCIGAASAADATIIMVDANSIQGANVLFNEGVQTGTTVSGQTQTGVQVNFTGTTMMGDMMGNIIRANGGQARLEGALDASTNQPNDTMPLTSLNFSLAGGTTFNNLEFNLFGGDATLATFILIDDGGQEFEFTRDLDNGENRFGFQGQDGQTIANVSIALNGGGIEDLRQLRLDAVTMAAVPEPGTWAMMLFGFGAVGYSLRSSKRTYRLSRAAL